MFSMSPRRFSGTTARVMRTARPETTRAAEGIGEATASRRSSSTTKGCGAAPRLASALLEAMPVAAPATTTAARAKRRVRRVSFM